MYCPAVHVPPLRREGEERARSWCQVRRWDRSIKHIATEGRPTPSLGTPVSAPAKKELPSPADNRLLISVTVLPIAERELRVAARKRSTFWIRLIAAIVAIVIGGGMLLFFELTGMGRSLTTAGRSLFSALTWISLGAALSTGLFFTSDCLSEEKREGTIGFLFLTDLRGYDVVLGKLLATSLRSFYALLAIVPVLGITLLLGGVAGAQFFKTTLALITALLGSLAVGLFVSAISRDAHRAMMMTLLLVVVWAGAGPALDAIGSQNQSGGEPLWSLTSPAFLFLTASAWGRASFWSGLAFNHVILWGVLGLACVVLPRAWQEKTRSAGESSAPNWAHTWKFGGAERRGALRRVHLELHPMVWLVCRERWQRVTLWIASLIMTGTLAMILVSDKPVVWWQIWSGVAGLLMMLVYLGAASQASRFLCDAKRNGLLELLLATPLSVREILRGHRAAFLRLYGPALLVCLICQMLGSFLSHTAAWSNASYNSRPLPAAATGTNATGNVRSAASPANLSGGMDTGGETYALTLAISGATTLNLLANLAAIFWVGMWMGLTSKTTNLASLKTIVFVQIIPWFAMTFLSGLMVPLLIWSGAIASIGSAASRNPLFYSTIMTGVYVALSLLKDGALILWARKRLHERFRDQVAAVPMELPSRPPPLPVAG